MFPKLKCVKTNSRCFLSLQRLENILRIIEEGPAWEEYDPLPSIELWHSMKQRPCDEKQMQSYTTCKSHRRLSTISSDESNNEAAEKESQEGGKEDKDMDKERSEETDSHSLFSDSDSEDN